MCSFGGRDGLPSGVLAVYSIGRSSWLHALERRDGQEVRARYLETIESQAARPLPTCLADGQPIAP